MGLKEDLLRGIYSYGFEKPSAIQQRAIKPLILMRDTIAQAQSGTGKTATFTIGARHLRPTAHAQQPQQPRPHQACPAYASVPRPVGVTLTLAALACAGLLQNIDLNNRDCQALILAPTRELASQIVKVVMAIGDYLGVSTMVRATPRTPGRPAAAALPPARSGGAGRGCPWEPWRGRSLAPPRKRRDCAGRHSHARTRACAHCVAPGQPRQPRQPRLRRSVRHAGLCEVPPTRR